MASKIEMVFVYPPAHLLFNLALTFGSGVVEKPDHFVVRKQMPDARFESMVYRSVVNRMMLSVFPI